VNKSEPDRRAAKQRVQQQVQIQIAIHSRKLTNLAVWVKSKVFLLVIGQDVAMKLPHEHAHITFGFDVSFHVGLLQQTL
jgi:hypothetical protein